MVKMRYFPSKGITKDVAGIISIRTKKKNVNESKMETDRVTCARVSVVSYLESSEQVRQ